MVELMAKPDGCEEASTLTRKFYIPCNAPATVALWSKKDRKAYRMCGPCADHNTRRGMELLEPYTVLAELFEWAAQMGGWEAPVWKRAQALLDAHRTDIGT